MAKSTQSTQSKKVSATKDEATTVAVSEDKKVQLNRSEEHTSELQSH